MKAVIFDLDGVLCTLDHEARLAELTRRTGVPEATIDAAIYRSGFEYESDSGQLSADEYLRGFGERIGYPLTEADWVAGRRAGLRASPEVWDLARDLAARLPVALLTNNGLLLKRTFPEVVPEVFELFGPRAFVSAEFKACKPSTSSYLGACRRLGVDPGDALMIDDKQENIDGAIAAGLQGHLYKGVQDLNESPLYRLRPG